MTRVIETCRVVQGATTWIAVIGVAGVAQTVAVRLDPKAGQTDLVVVAAVAERLGSDLRFEEPRWQAVHERLQADRRVT